MHSFITNSLDKATELARGSVQFEEDIVYATNARFDKSKEDKEALSIAAVRHLLGECYTSAKGEGKAIVIPNAEMMRWDAQNALLKVIEEPPEGVKFFLVASELNMLLPTIRSRCELALVKVDSITIDEELYGKIEKLVSADMGVASNRHRAIFELGELKDRKEEVVHCLEKIYGGSHMQLKIAKMKMELKANCNWTSMVYQLLNR